MKIDDHPLTPPTYLKVDEFTWVFQEIVSTYGTPSYREVNPAFFTIVTFPFLFGMMFGDMCHGLILTGLSLYLCGYKDALIKRKSILAPLLKARFLLLLMGIFATFCGFMYNDFAGLNLNLFRTCYYAKYSDDAAHAVVNKESDCVYPAGLDPYWKYSSKELQFENSFKMKLSVIFGVIQMTLGVFMKLVNAREFKKKYDIYFEFLPQVIFLLALFGFMDYLIFAKWLTDYSADTNKSPFIITAIINMFLKFGDTGLDKPIITGQQVISILLFITLFLCVPLMLLPKPFLLRAEHDREELAKKAVPAIAEGTGRKSETEETTGIKKTLEQFLPHGQGFRFSEIFVHQLIETIEYVLGTISNCASYLRLWALSLAHAQLSTVFIEYALMSLVEGHSHFMTFPAMSIAFTVFAGLTFGVLMCMDSLECFLHTLRLHWVEFQNKFFKADGYKYAPFSYKDTLEQFIEA